MTRILITGATGFIGSHLFDLLLSRGYDVSGISNSQSKKSISKISLLDKNKLNSYFRKNNFDVVIHLAAILDDKDPLKILHTNYSCTMNLLQLCIKNDVSNFIFSSSHAVYGKTNYLPIDEEHSTSPQSSYGITKLMEENLCRLYRNYFNLNTIILRITSVFSEDQKKTKLIPNLVLNAFNEKQIIIHQYKNGFQIMDMIHVDDVCNSILCSIKNMKYSGIYNIASGNPITVKEIAHHIQKITDTKITIKNIHAKTNHFTYDTSKAKKFLKFKSKIKIEKKFQSFFDDIIQNN